MIQVAPGPFKLFILVELELQGKMFSCSRSFERGQRTRQEQLQQLRTSLETFILCQSLVGATVSRVLKRILASFVKIANLNQFRVFGKLFRNVRRLRKRQRSL